MTAVSGEQDWLLSAAAGGVRQFYATIGVQIPSTPTEQASVRCFANPTAHSHGDRNASCSLNLVTGVWCCHGCGEKGNAYSAAMACGYSETQARRLAQEYGLFLERKHDAPKMPTERRVQIWHEQLYKSPRILQRLTVVKGWNRRGYWRCQVGWDGERITFPVRSATRRIVGLVRYLPGGDPKSKAIPGSRRDLFPPPELCSTKMPLFLVEGEPAAVSVWSTGHQAVAIPGVNSWRPEMAQRFVGRRVVMLPDCDPQGRDLAQRVSAVLPKAMVVDLAPERQDGYDVGDLVLEAAQEDELLELGRILGRLAA